MALKDLFKAIENNKIREVKLSLRTVKNVNGKKSNGETPFHQAAQVGNVKIVRLLLEGGANLNMADKAGLTALHFASLYGNHEVVEFLLDHGAQINVKTHKEKITPLICAIFGNQLKSVKLLLMRGANSEQGMPYVEELFKDGQNDIARLIINHFEKGTVEISTGEKGKPTFSNFIRQQDVKKLLRETYNRPSPPKEIELPICPTKTAKPRIMGQAFDIFLKTLLFKNFKSFSKDSFDLNYLRGPSRKFNNGEEIFDKSKGTIEDFFANKVEKDALFVSCLHMAYFEATFRSGQVYDSNILVDDLDIEDLNEISKLLDIEIFKPKHSIYFSPKLNVDNSHVGIAEGDLIVDDKLIDIKTVKNTSDNTNQWNQLVGYYVLCRFRGIRIDSGKSKKVSINHVGIYYSRHGKLVLKDIRELIPDSKTERKLKEIFLENA